MFPADGKTETEEAGGTKLIWDVVSHILGVHHKPGVSEPVSEDRSGCLDGG